MKLLLYCTKSKPYLFESINEKGKYMLENNEWFKELNGKIVAECDFEVEEIEHNGLGIVDIYETSLCEEELCYKSCLNDKELHKYLNGSNGYAIHIKNLHIFDEPKELSNYFTKRPYNDINKIFTDEYMKVGEWYRPINNAPQNMMYAYDNEEKKILISIQSQWLCKILNGEKTIEVRKKVLKEIKNE